MQAVGSPDTYEIYASISEESISRNMRNVYLCGN